jgi:hypothetical protein
MMLTEPTSLNGGEGLMAGSPGDVEGSVDASRGGGEVEERGGGGQRRAKFNCDRVDVEFKLCLPHR